MTSSWSAFVHSLSSSDRKFREDFDLVAARDLVGSERVDALEQLLVRLGGGAEPRAPRALVAMEAREVLPQLRVAATRAEPLVAVEAALATWALGGDDAFARMTLQRILGGPGAAAAKVRAILGLEQLGGPETLETLFAGLEDALNPVVRAVALTAIFRLCGALPHRVKDGRLESLCTRATSRFPSFRAAARPELLEVVALATEDDLGDWLEVPDTTSAAFSVLRQRMLEGRPAGTLMPLCAADLSVCPRAERELLWAWAVVLFEQGHANGAALVCDLEVPGGQEAAGRTGSSGP